MAVTHTVNHHHRANPEFIGSRNCVSMAFTAEPAWTVPVTGAAFSGVTPHGPIYVSFSFPTPTIILVCINRSIVDIICVIQTEEAVNPLEPYKSLFRYVFKVPVPAYILTNEKKILE